MASTVSSVTYQLFSTITKHIPQIPTALNMVPDEHQQRLAATFTPSSGMESLLLFHGTGTGKTCTAICIAENFDKNVLVLVKNENAEAQFRDEVKLWSSRTEAQQAERMHYKTHQAFINEFDSKEPSSLYMTMDFIIIDEAHHALTDRFYTTLMKQLHHPRLSKTVKRVAKVDLRPRLLLLSATPLTDKAQNLTRLASLLTVLCSENAFEQAFSTALDWKRQEAAVMERLHGRVSVQETTRDLPVVTYEGEQYSDDPSCKFIMCPLSEYQLRVYLRALTHDALDPTEEKETENETGTELQLGNGKRAKFNCTHHNALYAGKMSYPGLAYGSAGWSHASATLEAMSGFRDIMLNKLAMFSSKLHQLSLKLQQHRAISSFGTVLIHTSYINHHGTLLLSELMTASGYQLFQLEFFLASGDIRPKYAILQASQTVKDRQILLDIFNSSDNCDGSLIQVLIVTPSCNEGINLRHVKHFHFLDPLWNLAKRQQIIGRATRRGCYSDIPLEMHGLSVYQYVCQVPETTWSVDLAVWLTAFKKSEDVRLAEELLKKSQISPNPVKRRRVPLNVSSEIDEILRVNRWHVAVIEDAVYQNLRLTDLPTVHISDINVSLPSISEDLIETVLYNMDQQGRVIQRKDDTPGILRLAGPYVTLATPTPFDMTIFQGLPNFTAPQTDSGGKRRKTQSEVCIEEPLTPEQIAKDLKISKEPVYGHYRSRVAHDGCFRVVDQRSRERIKDTDGRKQHHGIKIESLSLAQLRDLLHYFGVYTHDRHAYTTALRAELLRVMTNANLVLAVANVTRTNPVAAPAA